MAKNEKLNEEAALNNNLTQADLLMAKNSGVEGQYTKPPMSDEEKAFEMIKDEKLTGDEERKRLQTYVDLGDVF
ncbi:hypothetical protein [Bacillus sp. Marseille-P3661]|uniref:hypothetical protein n=1 Tax=Bacillus sp. Marseille-P3661 TaxID=1936234 RepID=UPI000C839ADF|nr:hypothetical protein [Bacillus sp. Marseille-P3661]